MRRILAVLFLCALLAAATQVAVAKPDDHGGDDQQDERQDDPAQQGDDQGSGHDDPPQDHEGSDSDRHEGKGHRHSSHEPKEGDRNDPANDHGVSDAGSPTVVPLPSTGGDAALRQIVYAEKGRLRYVFVVGGLGPLPAQDVRLDTDLPDLGGSWTLAGPGVQRCALQGTHLNCRLGDLVPGQLDLVQATGTIGRPPPWQVKTTARLAAGNDLVAGNDAATTTVGVLLT